MTTASNWHIQGVEALKRGDLPAAELAFSNACGDNPHSGETIGLLARTLLLQGHFKETEGLIDTFLASHPEDAACLYVKALCLMEEERFSDALAYLQKALLSRPGLLPARYNLAIVLRKLEKTEEAEKCLSKYVSQNPDDLEALYLWANTLLLLDRPKEAAPMLEKLLKRNPSCTPAYLDLGVVLSCCGRSDLEEKLYRNGLTADPAQDALRRRLIQFLLRQKRVQEALLECEALAKQSQQAHDWMQAGNMALLVEDGDRAVECFQKAATAAPEAWEPHYNLAEICSARGQIEEAGREYEEAARRNNRRPETLNGLGLWLLQQNRVEEAVGCLTAALNTAPESPEIAFNLSLALVRADRSSEAAAILKTVADGQSPLSGTAARLLKTLSHPSPVRGKRT